MDFELKFLDRRQALRVAEDRAEKHNLSDEVVDHEKLEGTLDGPGQKNGANYIYRSVCRMGGIYFYLFVLNAPWGKGNRLNWLVGHQCAAIFMCRNGVDLTLDENSDIQAQEIEAMAIGIESGRVSREEVMQYFCEHSVALEF